MIVGPSDCDCRDGDCGAVSVTGYKVAGENRVQTMGCQADRWVGCGDRGDACLSRMELGGEYSGLCAKHFGYPSEVEDHAAVRQFTDLMMLVNAGEYKDGGGGDVQGCVSLGGHGNLIKEDKLAGVPNALWHTHQTPSLVDSLFRPPVLSPHRPARSLIVQVEYYMAHLIFLGFDLVGLCFAEEDGGSAGRGAGGKASDNNAALMRKVRHSKQSLSQLYPSSSLTSYTVSRSIDEYYLLSPEQQQYHQQPESPHEGDQERLHLWKITYSSPSYHCGTIATLRHVIPFLPSVPEGMVIV